MSRKIKITTLSLPLLNGFRPVQEHLDTAINMLEKALKDNPDVAVLPESYPTFESSPEETARAAASVEELNWQAAKWAKKAGCYIINPILEKDSEGNKLYNSAYVLDRQGQVCLHYRKTHLAAYESYLYHAIPGDDFPVLKTDFGVMGVMLCFDLHFPEVTRILASRGAELICMPTQSFGPSQDMLLTLMRARAFDSQIYFVCANFVQEPYFPGCHIGRSCIIGPDGVILADSGSRSGFVSAEVDLDWVTPINWSYTDYEKELTAIYPDWRTVLNNFRRPDLYHLLTGGKKE